MWSWRWRRVEMCWETCTGTIQWWEHVGMELCVVALFVWTVMGGEAVGFGKSLALWFWSFFLRRNVKLVRHSRVGQAWFRSSHRLPSGPHPFLDQACSPASGLIFRSPTQLRKWNCCFPIHLAICSVFFKNRDGTLVVWHSCWLHLCCQSPMKRMSHTLAGCMLEDDVSGETNRHWLCLRASRASAPGCADTACAMAWLARC